MDAVFGKTGRGGATPLVKKGKSVVPVRFGRHSSRQKGEECSAGWFALFSQLTPATSPTRPSVNAGEI